MFFMDKKYPLSLRYVPANCKNNKHFIYNLICSLKMLAYPTGRTDTVLNSDWKLRYVISYSFPKLKEDTLLPVFLNEII